MRKPEENKLSARLISAELHLLRITEVWYCGMGKPSESKDERECTSVLTGGWRWWRLGPG